MPDVPTTNRMSPVDEPTWLTSVDIKRLLVYVIGATFPRVQAIEAFPACKTSDRKLRLFACACYRRISHVLPDALARECVDVAERFAEGRATDEERHEAHDRIGAVMDGLEPRWRASQGNERAQIAPTHTALGLAGTCLWDSAQKAAYYASSNAYLGLAMLMNPGVASYDPGYSATQAAEERAQLGLLRCIVGNPFRVVMVQPEWQNEQVVTLAQGIYDENAFERLAMLADALREAGCTDSAMLDHCRNDGPHGRGCWVVDVLLGYV